MKLSVSLPEDDVEFLDSFAASQGIDSRSAVVHRAIRLLKSSQLGVEYEQAWLDWDADHGTDAWDTVVGDGLPG